MMATSNSGSYFGKYRATVKSNADPLGRGRLELNIPEVFGSADSKWAEACVPLSGATTNPAMGVFLVPPVGTGVWVEFERGDSDYPIWVGCIWPGKDSSGVPSAFGETSNIVLQTLGQNRLVISGGPGDGITLKAFSGAEISITQSGIKIDNGQGATIELTGRKVSINGEALEVE